MVVDHLLDGAQLEGLFDIDVKLLVSAVIIKHTIIYRGNDRQGLISVHSEELWLSHQRFQEIANCIYFICFKVESYDGVTFGKNYF